jgi:hypothetical protein
MVKRLLLLCTVLSIPMSSVLLRAQKDAASLEGRVSDTSGAVIPKAIVTVTNIDTNLAYHAESDANGGWAISPVRIGTYRVLITAPGFKTAVELTMQQLQVAAAADSPRSSQGNPMTETSIT